MCADGARSDDVVQGLDGVRSVPAKAFFVGYLTTVLKPVELITEIRVPRKARRASHGFTELTRRANDFAVVAEGAAVDPAHEGGCRAVSLAFGGVADRPLEPGEAVGESIVGTALSAGDVAVAWRAGRAGQSQRRCPCLGRVPSRAGGCPHRACAGRGTPTGAGGPAMTAALQPIPLGVTVNGRDVSTWAVPPQSALEFLRDSLGQTDGTHACDVEIDTQSGALRIVRYVSSHDLSRAISVLRVKGQIEGGVVQGIGFGLNQDIDSIEDQLKSTLFADYLIPTSTDVPDIEAHFFEKGDGKGPFGAKGHRRAADRTG